MLQFLRGSSTDMQSLFFQITFPFQNETEQIFYHLFYTSEWDK